MKRYVYIFSNHEEDGADEVQATIDRDRVAEIFAARLERFPGYDDYSKQEAKTELNELLKLPDAELAKPHDGEQGSSGHRLMSGWGGEQLHVVELL